MKQIIIGLILFSLFSTGCETKPKFEPEKVAHLYVDLLMIDESYKFDQDSLKIFADSIFNHYQISEEQYKNEIESFQFSEETWSDFFSLAEKYLDTLKKIEDRSIAQKEENALAKKDSSITDPNAIPTQPFK